jgi:MFS family permease
VIADRRLFFRLLLPGFLTSLGAGQLIPFLNVFVAGKFGLGLAAVNAIFAVASLGTAIAILGQPALARRFGRIGSIVLVQGASIPFIVVLGFSPVLWTVVVALTVRNSLMNAGSPIFDAFSMERVSPGERATLAAGMTLLWSLGWVIAPIYYGLLQDRLGFTAGYAVDFVTIIVLYTIATSLLWHWFRGTDTTAGAGEVIAPIPVETPTLLEHA